MEHAIRRKEGNFAGANGGCFEPRQLFAESGVVAVEKPAGLSTQAPDGIESVEAWLRRRLAGSQPPQSVYVGVPHRLDRPVSGVLLLASTPRAARKLSRQFERRQVEKTYVAMLAAVGTDAGAPVGWEGDAAASVEWRDLVEKVPDEPRARVVLETGPLAREAVTRARLLARLPSGCLLVELKPLTGRMHQLRLQAAARGMPVVGDELYSPPAPAGAEQAREHSDRASFGPPTADPRARPIALHAWRIRYTDPDTSREITIEAPLPSFWPDEARRAITAPTMNTGS
jgi:23S rRNA pseudouridine1911/1915/1917 synthase